MLCFLWFEQKLRQGARLSGPLSKQNACELARTQGTDCTPSDGWLSGWKARHNIVFKKRSRMRTSELAPACLLIIELVDYK